MKIAVLGHMGRDEALVERLFEHEVHVLGQWENPGLSDKATLSGGNFYRVTSIADPENVADCVEAISPDMFVTNFDDALASGVVDVIKQRVQVGRIPELWLPCPDREASRIEWDKFFLRLLIDEVNPKYNPVNFMAIETDQIEEAIAYFESRGQALVVKPRGLTGGKGVKVMGKHLDTYKEAWEYANTIVGSGDQGGVEIQEKIEGHEFTLQLFTDGKTLIEAPSTYDYPYREDGDVGPGTGGMGSFSMEDGLLPFVNEADYNEALELMNALLGKLREREIDYKGVLYPTFFKTKEGLKIVETNARGGDPELVNIVDLMQDDVDMAEVLKKIASGDLSPHSIKYRRVASAMIYLVSPDYGYRRGAECNFGIDKRVIDSMGCKLRFASAERSGPSTFRTVGSSRTVGVSALGTTPWEARSLIHDAIRNGFSAPLSLDFRRDIAKKTYVDSLKV